MQTTSMNSSSNSADGGGAEAGVVVFRERLALGGSIALHDALPMPDKPQSYKFGIIGSSAITCTKVFFLKLSDSKILHPF